jgi:TPR repeat protein
VFEIRCFVGFPDQLQATAKLAHSGNPEAQFSLGFSYDIGNEGLEVNTEEAICWYTLSAEQRYPPAQHNLGVLYATGHKGKMERNYRDALRWYKAAAESGNASAQFHAAMLLISPKGENEPNPEYAFHLLNRAVRQRHMMATTTLGTAMFEGKICPKDEKKGLEMLQRPVASNDPVALHNLALIYKLGLGVTIDIVRSSAYFGMAKRSRSAKMFPQLAQESIGENFIHY